jgi:hypothetical protein
MTSHFQIGTQALAVKGRLCKVARLRDEYHEFVAEPAKFLPLLAARGERHADLFTFIQPISEPTPQFPYPMEWEHTAVLAVSSYEHWWKRQINDKTRNRIRKATKCGVVLREVAFSDELVHGIARIYNETPLRQGRRFRHYGKGFPVLKAEHATFLERSDFVGAYHAGELIGFIKLVHGQGVSHLMQIISMDAHRDKAPTNALVAKAVELCAAKGVPLLHYGSWSRRSMGDFKKHHAFARVAIPRYYVPLTWRGHLALKVAWHRDLREKIPEAWVDRLAAWRNHWNAFTFRTLRFPGAVAQLAERRS